MLLVLIVFFGLPLWNLARLFGKAHPLWIIAPVSLFLALFLTVQIFEIQANGFWFQWFKDLSFYWIISNLMLFGISIIGLLVEVTTYRLPSVSIPKKIIGISIIGLTFAYFGASLIHGQKIITENIVISTDKITEPYNFVHISDVHVGSTNEKFVRRIVEKIKMLNPDFVVITGDFIDEFHAKKSDIAAFNDISVPIYLITGNHEYYIDPFPLPEIIEDTQIQLIDGKRDSYKELDIIGINELESISPTMANLGGVNTERYTILLDHQPISEEASIAESKGVDLMLSGHTHRGQIWPTEYLIRLRYEFVAGLYDIGKMKLHVNQGTGTIGPKMRLGTSNEITLISLNPPSETNSTE